MNENAEYTSWLESQTQFDKYLKVIEKTEYEQNTTATGLVTIQQTTRNNIRKEGIQYLKHDLELLYGEHFSVLETADGIVIAIENEPGDFTISWELKSTIKSIDYDPFIKANEYDEEQATKAEKKARQEKEKATKQKLLEEKRAKKLAEIEAKRNLIAN